MYLTFDPYMVNLAINDLSCTNDFIFPVISHLLCVVSRLSLVTSLWTCPMLWILFDMCHCYTCCGTVTYVVVLLAHVILLLPRIIPCKLHSQVALLHLLYHWYICSATVVHVVSLLVSCVALLSYATWLLPCPVHWILLQICSCYTTWHMPFLHFLQYFTYCATMPK